MADKKDISSHPSIVKSEISSLKGLSFRDYLKSELRRGYLLENDEERYTARREKVYTFFKIPREIEKFVAYGFFQCADSFFFVFTFLPIRFALAIWALITRPLRKLLGLNFSKNRRILKPAEIVDLLKGVMVVVCCYIMGYIDTSVCYHIIKTQSTIKLYLFFNMLEIADRLMSAFGQDTLDALFWTATEPRGRKREHFGVLFHLLVAITYVAIHSTIVLLQALTLNVAINSDNKGLLTIVISNNFVELKGAVFKKFDRNNLLQISCSDVRERFHNCVLLLVVVVQTMKEYAWKEERFWILLPDCLLVCGTEVLVDWLKHAFITRFNDIPSDAYKDYTVLLASDLIMCKHKYAYSDHSDLVARRMGFIPLPLGVVMYRILSQSIVLSNPASYLIFILGFMCVLSFRVLNGIIILGKACDLIEGAEKRRSRKESTSEHQQKTNTADKTPRRPTKVEAATSPFRAAPTHTAHAHTKTRSLEVDMGSISASSSMVSTPIDRSNSLEFLGDSKRSLMANSMVNLASVGINEGAFSTSKLYRMQTSLESIASEAMEGCAKVMDLHSDGGLAADVVENESSVYGNVRVAKVVENVEPQRKVKERVSVSEAAAAKVIDNVELGCKVRGKVSEIVKGDAEVTENVEIDGIMTDDKMMIGKVAEVVGNEETETKINQNTETGNETETGVREGSERDTKLNETWEPTNDARRGEPEATNTNYETDSEGREEMRNFKKRHPFISCDSLRYRGSTDGDLL